MKSIRSVVAVGTVVCLGALGLGIAGAGAQPSAKATIKVGTILPVDAPGLSLEDRANAVEAGIKGFNKRGGVNGQKIEWILCDSMGDPNTEVQCARDLVEEGVVATLSDSTTLNTATTSQILKDAGVARIGLLPAGLADYQAPNSFPMYPGPVGQFGAYAKFLIDKGTKKLAIFIHDAPAAKAIPSLLGPEIENQGGELVTTVYIPAGATDYSQFVAQAQSAGAEGALLMIAVAEGTATIKAATQLNWDVTIGATTSSYSGKQLAALGKLPKSGVFGDANPAPSDSVKKWPGLKTFLADMKAFDKKKTAQTLNTSELQSWLGVLAFVNAMKGVETIDAASVLETVNTVQDIDLMGLQEPWTPSAYIDHPIFKQISNPNIYPAKWNGKSFTTSKDPIDAYALWPAS